MDNVVFNRIWWSQCFTDLCDLKKNSVWVFENGTRCKQKNFFFWIILLYFQLKSFLFLFSHINCRFSYIFLIWMKTWFVRSAFTQSLITDMELGDWKCIRKKTCLVAGHCVTSSHGLLEDPIWWLFSVDDFYFYIYSL